MTKTPPETVTIWSVYTPWNEPPELVSAEGERQPSRVRLKERVGAFGYQVAVALDACHFTPEAAIKAEITEREEWVEIANKRLSKALSDLIAVRQLALEHLVIETEPAQ